MNSRPTSQPEVAGVDCAYGVGGSVTVRVRGDLDQLTIDRVQPVLIAVLEQSPNVVEIDLSDVSIFGSAAVRMLHDLASRAAEHSLTLHIGGASGHVRAVLAAVHSPLKVTDIDGYPLEGLIGRAEFDRTIAQAVLRGREAVCITTGDLDRGSGPEILFVNRAFTDLTGYSADEAIGQTPKILQGPLTSRDVLDRLRRNVEAGEPFAGETVNYRLDGTPFIMNWRIVRVGDNARGESFLLAMQNDGTELRRLARFEAGLTYIDSQRRGLDPWTIEREERLVDAMLGSQVALLEGGVAAVSYRSSRGEACVRSTAASPDQHEALVQRLRRLGSQPNSGSKLAALDTSELVVSAGRRGSNSTGVLLVADLHPDRVRLADPHLNEQLLSYSLRLDATD